MFAETISKRWTWMRRTTKPTMEMTMTSSMTPWIERHSRPPKLLSADGTKRTFVSPLTSLGTVSGTLVPENVVGAPRIELGTPAMSTRSEVLCH